MRIALISAFAALAACSQASAPPPSLTIDDAYITLPAPGRDVSGGGATFSATGEAYTIVSFSTPVAQSTELHTMTMEDGVMQMRKLDSLSVGSGETLTLGPGGDHLMFFGVEEGLAPGTTIVMEFTIEGANTGPETLQIEADVREFAAD